MKTDWYQLREPEHTQIWDLVYQGLDFRPSTAPSHWPGFREPLPSITYLLPNPYDEEELDELFQVMWEHFHVAAQNEWLYALDWQHDGFGYAPSSVMEPDKTHPWKRGLYPDGEYAITLAGDLSWGTLGHPWEHTICVFGEPLLFLVNKKRPRMFRQILRRDGVRL